MQFTATVKKHILQFHFSAGTSRGILTQKDSWFLKIEAEGRKGIGEAGPLEGLSTEGIALGLLWPGVLNALQHTRLPESIADAYRLAQELSTSIPSIQFSLETALLDWLSGGTKVLFQNSFSKGASCIPINGLIWMGDRQRMRARIDEKLEQGYHCLKLKIGALNFEEELSLLRYIREQYTTNELQIRVDANGAFAPENAPEKLARLAEWDIHSIEQPIRQGQPEHMRELCLHSPIPVALDEELIGVPAWNKAQLLDYLKPPYIILKPTLLGGLAATAEWIRLAEERTIGWWITSALESNIGLNAIAQFTAEYRTSMPQGLGTGQLYTNNLPSPLQINAGTLCYRPQVQAWDLSLLEW